MSEYNEISRKVLDVLKKKSFLFPDQMEASLQLGLYFEWFERYIKTDFSQMPSMVHFSVDILDQFSEQIVWTGFSSVDPKNFVCALHTLVQVRKDYHILFLHTRENNEPSVMATLYVIDPQDYMKFLTDNEKFIVRQKNVAGLLAGMHPHSNEEDRSDQ